MVDVLDNYLEARCLTDHKNILASVLVSEKIALFVGRKAIYAVLHPPNHEFVAEIDFIAGGFIWSGVDYWAKPAGRARVAECLIDIV